MVNKDYYFYVLYCADDSLYGGFTDDVQRRFATHQAYKGAKYTKVKSRHPLQLAYYQQFSSKHDALSAEYHFKHQSRAKKLAFLKAHGVFLDQLRQRLSQIKWKSTCGIAFFFVYYYSVLNAQNTPGAMR